ncbi:MAG: AAA family ATPase [Byssovorax sp.]
MITSVSIENFRGVREGRVDGLAPISILVGPNNAGKSTLLEAIAAAGYGSRADEVAKLLLRRGGPPVDALEQVVRGAQNQSKIVVDGKREDGEAQRWQQVIEVTSAGYGPQRSIVIEEGLHDPMVRLTTANAVVWVDASSSTSSLFFHITSSDVHRSTDVDPNFLLRFVDVEAVRGAGALEDAYTTIEQAGKVEAIVRSLQRSMAGLRDLRILKSKTTNQFILHAFFGNGPPVAVFAAGDGFKRFLELSASVLGASRSLALLEEPETYQHPRYLAELSTLLHLAAREGTQIILSTHSIELIDLLLHAPEAEGQAYPAVHRLRLHEGVLRATTVPRENAIIARDELLEDLRA